MIHFFYQHSAGIKFLCDILLLKVQKRLPFRLSSVSVHSFDQCRQFLHGKNHIRGTCSKHTFLHISDASFKFGSRHGLCFGLGESHFVTSENNSHTANLCVDSLFDLAEILIELDALENTTGRLEEAKGLIDKIRVRAGIPTIDEAWKKANHPEKANTAEGLREIVRRERQIEFYLENQRFWDLRRWKDAGILGEKVWGMNIEGDTDETFFVPTELQNIRTFKQAQYLMPIPMTETNKVPHIVQNPGY